MPGIGYDHPNQSHFTSRHFWEVGAADERLATGWLGRYLDRVGRPDNPLQGLSLDWSLQPSLATAKMPVAAVDAPDRYDFWARGVWGEVSDRMVDAIGRLGALPTHGDPGLEAASDAARQSARLYEQLTPFRPKDDRKIDRQPGRLSRRRRRVPAPSRRPRGDARGRAAAARRRALGARRLRHPRQPGAGARPTTSSSPPTRCSRSSAISRRAGSPTACSSTCGRSSAAARRRTARAAPTTAPPARAS